ncbi:MAG: hypothetical protein ABIQ29_08545 [Burkholderiaceae bacterium]
MPVTLPVNTGAGTAGADAGAGSSLLEQAPSPATKAKTAAPTKRLKLEVFMIGDAFAERLWNRREAL